MNNNSVISSDCCSDYDKISDNIDIITYFQPIISIKNKNIIGFESLCRGICKSCGRIISPFELFSKITSEENLFNLDLLARKSALKDFGSLLKTNKSLLLFLNFDVSLVEKQIENPDLLVNLLENTDITPHNIVIEITESKPCNINILTKFMESCRKLGFLIALDDVGTGYSNFDRLLIIQPDILKVDRSIISNIDKDYHKRAVFRTLARLSKKIGTFILAEGVETEGEIIYSFELGAELMQGFYFEKPQKINDEILENTNAKIGSALIKCKDNKSKLIQKLKNKNMLYNDAIVSIAQLLADKSIDELNSCDFILNYSIKNHDFIEALYVLDNKGFQITDTVLNSDICIRKTMLYTPSQKGDSHYFKDYFYYLQDGSFKKYVTESYISFLTGNLCRTLSLKFFNKEKMSFVICMDIKEEK